MNIDFISAVQKTQLLDLYKISSENFQSKCDYLENEGRNYIKTYLGVKADRIKDFEWQQLLKYFVWWRIYADLNLQEGEHYKKNFDVLIKGFEGNMETGTRVQRGIRVY